MILRRYQHEAQDGNEKFAGIFPAWAGGSRSVILVMATGTGKTIVCASVIGRVRKAMAPGRTMFIAHRQELILQARDKIKAVTGLQVDVEMGEFKARTDQHDMFKPKADVIVSTVQTHCAGGDGGGRIGKFDPNDFSLLVIDEGHHAVTPAYRRIIQYYMSNPNLVVLAMTATPDRTDERALGSVFDTVAYDYEISDAIKDGYLVPVEQDMISIQSLDFSHIRTKAGDLNGTDLEAVMMEEKNLYPIAGGTIQLIGDKRGIGFASSVNHARILANIFNRHRYGMAGFVSAKTDKEERKRIIGDFTSGKIQFIWNCGIFTEGFDVAGVEWIALARPTKSRALYAQMIGRGTRPDESVAKLLYGVPNAMLRRMLIARSSKPVCRVIDFVGVSGKHKLIHLADILGGNYSDEAVAQVNALAKASAGKPIKVLEQLEIAEAEIREAKRRQEEEEARKIRLVPRNVVLSVKRVDPFDLKAVKPVTLQGSPAEKTLSEKGRAFLRRQGYNPDKLTYKRSISLIREMMSGFRNKKASIGQKDLLVKMGFSKEQAGELSREQASQCIDACKANSWKRPPNFSVPRPLTEEPKFDESTDPDWSVA
jgi:superfamily II DNA or RNA helicase